MPVNYVACFQSIRDAHGLPLVMFTRWGSKSTEIGRGSSEVWFWRFENILTERDPLKLRITTLPDSEHGLQVPHPIQMNASAAEEGAVVSLPDGRLFVAMRTQQGCLYWSVSDDNGVAWSTPLPLRYSDTGGLALHPLSPAPLFEYAPGKYFLLFHNNDGYAFGASGPTDSKKNRRPMFIALGEFDAESKQPIRFSEPQFFVDSEGVRLSWWGRVEPCSYPSYSELDGTHYLWYPDRKHVVLGKILNSYLKL